MEGVRVDPNQIEEEYRLPRVVKAAAGVTVQAAGRAGATSRRSASPWSANGSRSSRRPESAAHEKKPAKGAFPLDEDLSGAAAQGREGRADDTANGSNGPETPRH